MRRAEEGTDGNQKSEAKWHQAIVQQGLTFTLAMILEAGSGLESSGHVLPGPAPTLWSRITLDAPTTPRASPQYKYLSRSRPNWKVGFTSKLPLFFQISPWLRWHYSSSPATSRSGVTFFPVRLPHLKFVEKSIPIYDLSDDLTVAHQNTLSTPRS